MPVALDTRAAADHARATRALGNATALAQWEYCFDRGDTDTSRGNATVGTAPSRRQQLGLLGPRQPERARIPSWNATAQKLIPAGGAGSGMRGPQQDASRRSSGWRSTTRDAATTCRRTSSAPARSIPNGNNGFNIEHLRNFNNAAPKIAFGFETQPGHGASDARGEYTIRRNNIGGVNVDSVGGTTYGGTGVYGAQIGGVWDALLGEGRNCWFFASSDWHNRGIFGPDDRRSTQDFYPGRVPAQLRHGAQRQPTRSCGRRRSSTACAPATPSPPAAS